MAKQIKKTDPGLTESAPIKTKKETKPKGAAKEMWPEADEITVSKKGLPKKATEKPTAAKKAAAPKKGKALEIVDNTTDLKAVEPYSRFTDYDIDLFKSGKHFKLYEKLGSHVTEHKGVVGTYFAVWAPNAQFVSVIGNFNGWNKGAHSLNYRWDASGIWEGFIPNVGVGETYKYFIKASTGEDLEKSDPFALRWELPPRTASIVADTYYEWDDKDWMINRHQHNALDKPYSVYEMHLGSWARSPESPDEFLSYRQIAESLVPYVKEMGFTHVEFMPLMEHPYYPSWGYQITGFFAASCRYGTPQDLMYLVEQFHKAGIGVILDWVPSHFPGDAHGLYNFDGTHLYEHADVRKGFHPDWKSYIFNYGRNEVRAFLISNALFWLDRYHVDGLRVDAVASMLYLDYSRNHGEWEPNVFGGNENLEAISFLKEFNATVYSNFPDVQTIAEESTSFAGVSRPVYTGGLGFGMKWMMGWMHDTLNYFAHDPIHRKYHQNQLTFSMVYAFTENFMLPFSHDEVVYGKGSMLNKMPGDEWQKFANLRLLYSFMFTHPGTKLLFMGSEFGQSAEWSFERSLDWHLLQYDSHNGIKETVKAINRLYRSEPSLYEKAFEWTGFEWIDAGNLDDSVIVYSRKGKERENDLVIVLNMTPVVHANYRIGVPAAGQWQEIFNSDSEKFWGSGIINFDPITTEASGWHGRDNSMTIKTPPLGAAIFKKVSGQTEKIKSKKLK
ncbi:1,4-alpha-glucan branching protein GlgB [Mucilaginibacter sp. 14171R-50]|uniref:1,4-alpha-glucan branching protein GlgB n=1 Tax=Mucilaginibacter sp. 14171R-50 TaxID=2703789 RepID=UPI00138D3B2F|nr:1,4-alpha-glucan branching protein GlgB [Mucilaginibacter sp. 14171R-50]QHS56268.1 1,4-alpha-glucan branching protein GlgB [Mucilaginibacter sp. 14171R-50]